MTFISVILPTFNEKENILPLIGLICAELQGSNYEILVVDDASPDGTAEMVKGCGIPGVCLIVRHEMPGYALSVRRGIEEARGDVVILMDSDFNHAPRYIPRMLQLLDGHDVVSASRFLPGGRMTPAWRGICSLWFNGFVRLLTGSKMTDNLFGFFVIRKDVLLRCPCDEIFFGFGDYGMRLLFYLQKHGSRVVEFPAVYGARRAGRGNGRLFRMLCQYTCSAFVLLAKGRIR